MALINQTYLDQKISSFWEHVQTPLYKNGYALITSSLLSSGLGMVYWLLAARLYSAEAIGISSALLAAMTFIVNLAHFNLPNGLNRFVPSAGNQTKWLILFAYGGVVLIAEYVCLVFLLGASFWSPSLAFIQTNPALSIFFLLATMGWCIFVLQDSALTGLRQAVWIPVENLIYAIAKIILLVICAFAFPITGVFVSWVVPIFLILPVVNWFIFRRIIPGHPEMTQPPKEAVDGRTIGRFVLSDYFASVVWMATANLLPIIVLEMLGAAANAWFYLAWNISNALYLIGRGMGMSLVTEGATAKEKIGELTYAALMRSLVILVPAVATLFVSAPYLLLLYGADYAENTTILLRLFAVAAIPGAIIPIYLGYLRIQKSMAPIVIVLTAQGVLMLGLSLLWMRNLGLVGIGYAWLITQTGIAAAVLFAAPHLFFWPMLNSLRHALTKMVGHFTASFSPITQEEIDGMFDALREKVVDNGVSKDLTLLDQLVTTNDVVVFNVGASDKEPNAIFKYSKTKSAAQSITHHANSISAVQQYSDLPFEIPRILAQIKNQSEAGVIESRLPGITLKEYIQTQNGGDLNVFIKKIVPPLNLFYQPNALTINLLESEIEQLVREPIELIRQEIRWLNSSPIGRKLDRLEQELQHALQNQKVPFSRIHGDLCPENIMVCPESGGLIGLIDWERSHSFSYPAVDLYHLLLTTCTAIDHTELERTIIDLISDPGRLTQDTHSLLGANQLVADTKTGSARTLILLAWLHHIRSNLLKGEKYRNRYFWLFKFVILVLIKI